MYSGAYEGRSVMTIRTESSAYCRPTPHQGPFSHSELNMFHARRSRPEQTLRTPMLKRWC